ncbi:MAG: radical SAM protein [Phycisphaerae bacterium]|nr:radical SAM protein [Phycisphaerae bacterium]
MTQRTSPNQVLRLLFWESTIKCNLKCSHCRRIESDEAAFTDISTEQAGRLIYDLAELGRGQHTMPVLVFSGGEPLCRADLFELVDLARNVGLVPALATNGTMVDSACADLIAQSGIARVSVSIDGATAEVHDRLRQLPGAFQRAIDGIKNLHEKKIPFQINITLTKHNAHQLNDVYNIAKSLGAVAVHVFMLVPVGCGQVLAETDMLSPEEYEQKMVEICRLDSLGELQLKVTCGPHYERVIRQNGLYRQRASSGDRGGHVPGRHVHNGPSKGCLAGLGVLFVGHNGDVFPCGYLPVKCGNILEEKLSTIWFENKDLAIMRDSGKLEGKCGVCGYREVCGGCRGRAYSVAGNYMAQEPFCAYIPPEAAH